MINIRALLSILTVTALLLVPASTRATHDEALFRPQAANVVGTADAGLPTPFTRVWTQMAGELAIHRLQERYVNLVPNWPMMLRAWRTMDAPVVAHMNIAWQGHHLFVRCTVNKAESNLLRRQFQIVLEVGEGSEGDIPPGTILALSDFRIFNRQGLSIMTADFSFEPGIFPDVLPSSLTITDQLAPDLWMTAKPGVVSAEHIFTSVPAPDGSGPRVYRTTQGITIN